MSFNKRYRPGWTLAECEKANVRTLTITCLNVDCRQEKPVTIADLKTKKGRPVRRDVPVNHMGWSCTACGHSYVKIAAMGASEAAVEIGPVWDLKDVRPARRRPTSIGLR